VRQANERPDHRAGGGACDRGLYRCAVDSRLADDNEKFARLNPRRLHCVAATDWIALKQRGLWRTRWWKGGGIPERIHGGESARAVKGFERNDRRVAGPRNMHDATAADRIATGNRESLNRGALRCLELIEQLTNSIEPDARTTLTPARSVAREPLASRPKERRLA
jgi:hypothetical protein